MRVAIIGLGIISEMHVNALKKAGQKIVAICDTDEKKLFSANEKYSLNAKTYLNYVDMFNGEKIDVVHICTPHYLHEEMVVEALKRDINVICEKPLAITERQLKNIKQAEENSKASLGVVFQNRYNEAVEYAKKYFKGEEITSAYGELCWNRGKDYYSLAKWRGRKKTEGGGVAINQAIHTLDLLFYFCGNPTSVVAHKFNDNLKGTINVEETAFAIFSIGKTGRVIFSATNAGQDSIPIRISLKSKNKSLELLGNAVIKGDKLITFTGEKPTGKIEWGSSHDKLIYDFYNKLKRHQKLPIGFSDGERATKAVISIYKSNGKNVKIN